MADRISRFESKIDTALRRLDELDSRLAALENRFATFTVPVPSPVAPTDAAGLETESAVSRQALVIASLTGRTFLVLGGAYLLRALTDSGIFPRPLGIALGLAYAAIWLALADRAGLGHRTASATFHGLAAAAVAFPLLFEAGTRFQVLSITGVVAGLTVAAALGVAIAWHSRTQGVAWVIAISGILTGIVLIRVTQQTAPFALFLVLLGIATYWVGHLRGWWNVPWPTAVVADAAVLVLGFRAFSLQYPEGLLLVLLVHLTLFCGYLSSVAIRTLALNHPVVRFEVVQSIAIILIGFGGAAYVTLTAGLNPVPLGLTGLLAGAGAYLAAFAIVAPRQDWKKFYLYSSIAVALTIGGGSVMLHVPTAAMFWIVLALAAAWLGKRFLDVTLSAHSAAYLLAAAVASGLLVVATDSLLGSATRPWRAAMPVALLTLAGAAVCSVVAPSGLRTFSNPKVLTTFRARRTSIGIPRAVALAIVVLGLAGVAVRWIVPAVAGAPGPASDAGIVATIRSIVLAAAVMLMGLLARSDRMREAAWLIYPLLILAGLKLLFEDFRQSEPATLFLALAIYGVALIVGPRLAWKH